MAALSCTLSNSIVPWQSLQAIMASRLVALNKNPGVRPIGVGESLRSVISKAVSMVTRCDAEFVCGSDQLCTGVKLGTEVLSAKRVKIVYAL